MEQSLTKLTEAFDKLEDPTDEEKDQTEKYVENTQEIIMKVYVQKSNLKQVLQKESTRDNHRTSGADQLDSIAASKLPVIPIPTFTGRK